MPKPNILIFMTDHQRADTVLPEHPALTPNLDRFSQEGVTFTHTFLSGPALPPRAGHVFQRTLSLATRRVDFLNLERFPYAKPSP